MRKKKDDSKDPTPRPSQRPADTSPVALSADLSLAEILAQSPPIKPRRSKKKESSANLGVYDADKDILDQYLHEVSKTAAADGRSRRSPSPGRCARVTTKRCRSW